MTNMRRPAWLLAMAFIVICVAVAGCSDDDGDSPAAKATVAASFPVTIKSSDGVDTTLKEAPKRIVTLSASATETLCALGAGDQLVAVERYENCPKGSKAKPELDAFRPSLEAVVAYQPDLVFVNSNASGLVENLRRVNVPVVYLQVPKTLDGVYELIGVEGRMSGRGSQAEALVAKLKERVGAIDSKVADVRQGPRVYHELDASFYSASASSFVGDFYKHLKVQNIASDATTEYPQLSAEVIIQRDPEVIVISGEQPGRTLATVTARAGWDKITAVKNGRVCVADPDWTSRPGPSIADGLDQLAHCVYPDRFR